MDGGKAKLEMHVGRERISANGATELVDDFVPSIQRDECPRCQQPGAGVRRLLRESGTRQCERLVVLTARERRPGLVEGGCHRAILDKLTSAVGSSHLDHAGCDETIHDPCDVELGASQCRGDRA